MYGRAGGLKEIAGTCAAFFPFNLSLFLYHHSRVAHRVTTLTQVWEEIQILELCSYQQTEYNSQMKEDVFPSEGVDSTKGRRPRIEAQQDKAQHKKGARAEHAGH